MPLCKTFWLFENGIFNWDEQPWPAVRPNLMLLVFSRIRLFCVHGWIGCNIFTEILKYNTVFQNVVDGNNHWMSNGNISTLLSSVRTDSLELCREMGILILYSRMCTDNKRWPQQSVSFPGFTASSLGRTLVVSRIPTCPWWNVCICRETSHACSNDRYDSVCTDISDTGLGISCIAADAIFYCTSFCRKRRDRLWCKWENHKVDLLDGLQSHKNVNLCRASSIPQFLPFGFHFWWHRSQYNDLLAANSGIFP
mgnify:CR=1 FL=1